MIIEAVEPETGKKMNFGCHLRSIDDIRDLLSFEMSEDELKRRISNLAISADAKNMIFSIAKLTLVVGQTVVRIGRKVVDIVLSLIREFPTATSMAIFGAVFGFLMSSVPIIGFLMGPLIGPLAVALGFAIGGAVDFANKLVDVKLRASMQPFEALRGSAV